MSHCPSVATRYLMKHEQQKRSITRQSSINQSLNHFGHSCPPVLQLTWGVISLRFTVITALRQNRLKKSSSVTGKSDSSTLHSDTSSYWICLLNVFGDIMILNFYLNLTHLAVFISLSFFQNWQTNSSQNHFIKINAWYRTFAITFLLVVLYFTPLMYSGQGLSTILPVLLRGQQVPISSVVALQYKP